MKVKVKGFDSQRTKHINENLAPTWNEKLTIAGVRNGSLSLEITVEDYDITVNDFMGKIVLPLRKFEDKEPIRKWYSPFNLIVCKIV